MTHECYDIVAPTIATIQVHEACASHRDKIVVLTTDVKILPKSSTIPTVRFLREIQYALVKGKI